MKSGRISWRKGVPLASSKDKGPAFTTWGERKGMAAKNYFPSAERGLKEMLSKTEEGKRAQLVLQSRGGVRGKGTKRTARSQ